MKIKNFIFIAGLVSLISGSLFAANRVLPKLPETLEDVEKILQEGEKDCDKLKSSLESLKKDRDEVSANIEKLKKEIAVEKAKGKTDPMAKKMKLNSLQRTLKMMNIIREQLESAQKDLEEHIKAVCK